MPKEHGS